MCDDITSVFRALLHLPFLNRSTTLFLGTAAAGHASAATKFENIDRFEVRGRTFVFKE